MYIYNFLHRMTDATTSQNTDLFFWDILYIPQERSGQLYPQTLDSLFVTFYTNHKATVEVFEPASTRALTHWFACPVGPRDIASERTVQKHRFLQKPMRRNTENVDSNSYSNVACKRCVVT
jgi:hypothetical protein